MISDDIIETVARHERIKPAVEEMIEHALRTQTLGVTSIASEHTFVCEVRGQKYDVKISLEVAGQKKKEPPLAASTLPCPKCRKMTVRYRVVESSCGAYEDEKHECTACGHSWWVDGPDA